MSNIFSRIFSNCCHGFFGPHESVEPSSATSKPTELITRQPSLSEPHLSGSNAQRLTPMVSEFEQPRAPVGANEVKPLVPVRAGIRYVMQLPDHELLYLLGPFDQGDLFMQLQLDSQDGRCGICALNTLNMRMCGNNRAALYSNASMSRFVLASFDRQQQGNYDMEALQEFQNQAAVNNPGLYRPLAYMEAACMTNGNLQFHDPSDPELSQLGVLSQAQSVVLNQNNHYVVIQRNLQTGHYELLDPLRREPLACGAKTMTEAIGHFFNMHRKNTVQGNTIGILYPIQEEASV